jgi:four helix bundle protein
MNYDQRGLQERTKRFSLRIVNLFKSLPNSKADQTLGLQLLRSGTSVGANTRAAFRARSIKEFKAKTGIVIEEADESLFWMEVLAESGITKAEKLKPLMNEANELVSIFVTIYKK